jgi:hypothetical protein
VDGMTEQLAEFRPRNTTRDLIEQAVARGELLDEIVVALGVSSDVVDKAMRRMDTITHPAQPRPKKVVTSTPRTGLMPCGTRAAYERHRRRGEEPCRPCFEAKSIRNARYRETS